MARAFEGECMRRRPGDEPLTLVKCHGYIEPLKGRRLSVAKATT